MSNRIWVCFFAVVALCVPVGAIAQVDSASSSCPVTFLGFSPSRLDEVNVRVKNVGTKKIVGLTFNAALADATEHWNWLGWPVVPLQETQANGLVVADSGTLRGFGWNKEIKPGAAKSTTWYQAYIAHDHGGGVAFVLTSALFADGTRWDELPDRSTCMALWHNYHKKGIASDVVLPPRPPVQAHTLHF
jgi:hypothetical protein